MSGLETAIRNALEKADRTNPEVRARIYQSARKALETGLRKQDVTDPATVAAQRHRLEVSIKTIEQEERMRLGIPTVDPVAEMSYEELDANLDEIDGNERDAEQAAYGDDEFGTLRAERLTDRPRGAPGQPMAPEPIAAGAPSGRRGRRAAAKASDTPSGAARRKRRRGAYARLFVTVILLAFIGMGAWWAYTSDLFLSEAERDTSVANPPAAVSEDDVVAEQEGSPSLDSANNFSKDWIEIFKPGDVDRVEAGGLASVKLISTGEGPAIQIVSSSGKPEASVRILLPEESLKLGEGQEATIALSLRSASDEPVEVTVDCDFGGQASCERHRFTVTSQRSDALLQVVPVGSGVARQPALVLNSDVDGKGRGVDLLAVRLLPVP